MKYIDLRRAVAVSDSSKIQIWTSDRKHHLATVESTLPLRSRLTLAKLLIEAIDQLEPEYYRLEDDDE